MTIIARVKWGSLWYSKIFIYFRIINILKIYKFYIEYLVVLGMLGMSFTTDYSIEAIVFISNIFNNTVGTVGFLQGVLSFDGVSLSGLPLALFVTGMMVFNSIFEFIFRGRLKQFQSDNQ